MSELGKPFVFDQDINRREVPALKVHPMVLGPDNTDLFAAGVADMDFVIAEPILAAMQARLEHGVFGYETVNDDLFPALTSWLLDRHNWQVNQAQILRAPNVLNTLAIAASLFTREGDGVIVQPPVFFDFYDILHENKRSVVLNPLVLKDGRYQMDFDDLALKAADPANKMVYLCNPHNPVGRVWTREELRTLGDICNQYDILVVTDEIHGDLVFEGHRYTPYASLGIDYANNCISCISPAKSFNLASCCSAFTVISDDEKRAVFQAENSRLTVNKNNAFANVAMTAAYREGGPWLDAVLTYLQRNVELAAKRLARIPEVDLIEPEGTFLLWLDFSKLGYSPEALTQFLKEQAKWSLTRGEAFGQSGEGFARLNIACTYSKLELAFDQLDEALDRVKSR